MKILKLLNSVSFTILIVYFLFFFKLAAEDKPIDIWNLDKKDSKKISQNIISTENVEKINQNSVYKLQANKEKDSIKLDQKISSKEIKIVGLYDPDEYGLTIDMWSNSDGKKIKNLFENIEKFKLSKDASEIMHISLLTNAHYPNQNITEQELSTRQSFPRTVSIGFLR